MATRTKIDNTPFSEINQGVPATFVGPGQNYTTGAYFLVTCRDSLITGVRFWCAITALPRTFTCYLFEPNNNTAVRTVSYQATAVGLQDAIFSSAYEVTAAKLAAQDPSAATLPAGQYCVAIHEGNYLTYATWGSLYCVVDSFHASFGTFREDYSDKFYTAGNGRPTSIAPNDRYFIDPIIYAGVDHIPGPVYGESHPLGVATAVIWPHLISRGSGLAQGTSTLVATATQFHSETKLIEGSTTVQADASQIHSGEADISGVSNVIGKFLASPKYGAASISGAATVTADYEPEKKAIATGFAEVLATIQVASSTAPAVVIDAISRKELVRTGSETSFSETVIMWHVAGFSADQYKVRLASVSPTAGFYIATTNGSENTEDLAAGLSSGDIVRTVINIEDLLVNDSEPDGAVRSITIFVRNQATGVWTTTADLAQEISLILYRTTPTVTVKDFIIGVDTNLQLSASREFSVKPEVTALPGGKTQAADVTIGLVSELWSTEDLIYDNHPDGFPEVETDVLLDVLAITAFDLTAEASGTIKCIITDVWGQESIQVLNFLLREAGAFDNIRCDAGVRLAIPQITREKDPVLEDKYLPIWDALLCQYYQVANSLQNLTDPQLAPLSALKFMFQEMGLSYPGEVPNYPEAALRRLLDKADQIHSTRFTLTGLRFYLGLLIPNSTVTVEGYSQGYFIFCNSATLGFPDAAKVASAGTSTDVNNYLIGDIRPSTVTITIAGTVSTEMKEFVRATIRQEIPYADDPINPLQLVVQFTP